MKLFKIIAIWFIVLVAVSLIGVGIWLYISKTDIPYCERFNFHFFNKDDTWKTLVKISVLDEENNEIELEGLEFSKKEASYKFRDWNKTEPDENGNVEVSFICDINIPIEYKIDTNLEYPNWTYNYSYNDIFAFDYYSGKTYDNLYIEHNYIEQDEEELIEEQDEEELENIESTEEQQEENLVDIVDGIKRYKLTKKETIAYKLTMPNDYDGYIICLNKKGVEITQMSKELIAIDDYYLINISDIFEEIKAEEEQAKMYEMLKIFLEEENTNDGEVSI